MPSFTIPAKGLELPHVLDAGTVKNMRVLKTFEFKLANQSDMGKLIAKDGSVDVNLLKSSFLKDGKKLVPFKNLNLRSIYLLTQPAGRSNFIVTAANLKPAPATKSSPGRVTRLDSDAATKALEENLKRLANEKASKQSGFIDKLDNKAKRDLANSRSAGAKFVHAEQLKKSPPAKAKKSSLAFLKDHRKTLLSGLGGGGGTTASLPVSPAMQATRSVPGTPAQASPLVKPVQTPEEIKKAAVKASLFHLLAPRPVSERYLLSKLNCDADLLRELLERWGRVSRTAPSKYELSDRAYKELELFSFPYGDADDREAAVACAIRAFDRMRVQTDDPLWQKLLPKNERDKGKCLSRLNFNQTGTTFGNATPHQRGTPVLAPQPAENERKHRLDPTDAAASGRSQSQGPIKKQKISEKEAQSKRIFSKSTTKLAQTAHSAKPKEKPASQVKEQPKDDKAEMKKSAKKDAPGAGGKFKSAEKVVDSDEDLSGGTPANSRPAEKQPKTSPPAKAAEKKPKTSPPAPLAEKKPKISPSSQPAAKPAVAKPAATKPAAAKPAVTKKDAAKPAAAKPTAAKPAAAKPASAKPAAAKPATAKKEAATPTAAATKPPAKATSGTKRKAEPMSKGPAKAARAAAPPPQPAPPKPTTPLPDLDPIFMLPRTTSASRRNSSTNASDAEAAAAAAAGTRPSSSSKSSSSSTTPLMAARSGAFGPLLDEARRQRLLAQGRDPNEPRRRRLEIRREPVGPATGVDDPTLKSAVRFRAQQRRYEEMRRVVSALPLGSRERNERTRKLLNMRVKLDEHKRGLYKTAGHLP